MGRSKKRKQSQLTEEEIWDDSALLKSWQDAVDEYKFYHSIHARGENVNEVLRRAEQEDEMAQDQAGSLEKGEVASGGASGDEQIFEQHPADENLPDVEDQVPRPRVPEARGPDMSEMSAPDCKDGKDILENMKMAYWWAGYYSALYDAQQSTNQRP